MSVIAPSAWLLAGAVVSRGSTLVAVTAVARLLSPTQFGRLAVLQVAVMLLAGVAGLGLGLALTRQVAAARVSNPEKAGAYIGLALLVTLIAGIATTGFFIVARSEVASGILRDPEATTAVLASAGAVLFGAIAANSQGALLGLEAFRSTALSQWGQGLGVGSGILIGAWMGEFQGALAGLSIGSAIGAVVSAAFLAKELSQRGISISWSPGKALWSSLWRPAAPAFAAFLVVALAALIGQLALTREAHGYAEVAVFNLAYRWHIAVLFVPSVIAPALLPALTRLLAAGDEQGGRHLFQIYGGGMLVVTVIPALAVILAARPLLALSGSYYAKHSAPLVVLALASIPSAANNVLSAGALGIGALRAWLMSDIALAGVLLGTAVILVPSHAATGLAVAYLLAYIATDATLVYPLREFFTGQARRPLRDH